MKIPLVTFAVGGLSCLLSSFSLYLSGIGEYVRPPSSFNNSDLFTIGPNALILNHATPEALSAAIFLIAKNRTLARTLAEAGYRTVESQFSVSSQMKLYELLYSSVSYKS